VFAEEVINLMNMLNYFNYRSKATELQTLCASFYQLVEASLSMLIPLAVSQPLLTTNNSSALQSLTDTLFKEFFPNGTKLQ
jgi:hypothetical protein